MGIVPKTNMKINIQELQNKTKEAIKKGIELRQKQLDEENARKAAHQAKEIEKAEKILAAIPASLLLASDIRTRRKLLAIGTCPHCTFDLSGLSPSSKCPECGKLKVKRIIGGGGGIIFKGTGFYQTDYRSKSYSDGASKDSTKSSPSDKPASAPAPSKSSGKGDSK